MPIQWYLLKGRREHGAFGDFFSVSDDRLKFSDEAWETYFKKCEYLDVGYDEANNTVYLKPGKEGGEGFKVQKEKSGNPSIRWKGFTASCKIHFDKTTSVKIQSCGGGMPNVHFLSLKGCCN